MRLRRLTPQGIAQFSEYLDLLENESIRLVPTHLLEDAVCSEQFGAATEIQKKTFGSRYAAAEYLDSLLCNTGVTDLDRDVGLWAWLTLFYFDEVCPKDKTGGRSPKERARYMPEPENHQRYYRHGLLGAYLIFRAHRDEPKRAMALLYQPLHIIDDIIAQLAAYQEIISNKSIIAMATKLYLDPVTGEPKVGARAKGPGSPRRLAAVLDQFDVTWDLYAMSLKEFWAVLPKEFDRFRPATP
jgi:hypothetical protein